MNENFLITWGQDDTTHYVMLPISEYEIVVKLKAKLTTKKISTEDVGKHLCKIKVKAGKELSVQTYDDTTWPFSEDNIKKIINIPEFGW